MREESEKPQHDRVRHTLDDWREAEHDVEKERPGSARRKMARKRADAARDDFHEAEDGEREVQGNVRVIATISADQRPRLRDQPSRATSWARSAPSAASSRHVLPRIQTRSTWMPFHPAGITTGLSAHAAGSPIDVRIAVKP
jgi:hypothetical protein